MSNPFAQSKEEKDAAAAIHFALLEKLDLNSIHKPFRNPTWRPNQRRNKNIKTILGEASKREAASASAAATPVENNSGAVTPAAGAGAGAGTGTGTQHGESDVSMSGMGTPEVSGRGGSSSSIGAGAQPNLAQASHSLSKLVLEKNLAKATPANGNGTGSSTAPAVTYTNVESAPSLAPQKRYCDVTGLHSRYTDPKSRLRYHDKEIFQMIRHMPQGVAEQFLEARNAQVILK